MNDLDRLMSDLGMADDKPAGPRSLHQIAIEIHALWAKPYFGAVPYIEAMFALDKITDKFGMDDGDDVVIRFLSNAKYWRGPDAKRIKAELKAML